MRIQLHLHPTLIHFQVKKKSQFDRNFGLAKIIEIQQFRAIGIEYHDLPFRSRGDIQIFWLISGYDSLHFKGTTLKLFFDE